MNSKSHMFWICIAFTLNSEYLFVEYMELVYLEEELEKKSWGELNFKQVAMITHRIDGLPEGNFSP